MKFNIYNNTRTLDIFDRIVKDYEKASGNKLNAEKIEDILRVNFVSDYIKYMSDKDLECIIEKDLCHKAYIPNVPITIFKNRHITVPIIYMEPYAQFQGFTANALEVMIQLSDYYDNIDNMSDEELGKAVTEVIGEELQAAMALPHVMNEQTMRERSKWQ